MIKKSVVFLFCLSSTIANAQDIEAFNVSKKVICADTKSVFKNITESKYKELPVWVGRTEDSTMSIIANEETGTWTLIQFNKEVACVIDAGTDHTFLQNKSGL
jgi:hypothetical protein